MVKRPAGLASFVLIGTALAALLLPNVVRASVQASARHSHFHGASIHHLGQPWARLSLTAQHVRRLRHPQSTRRFLPMTHSASPSRAANPNPVSLAIDWPSSLTVETTTGKPGKFAVTLISANTPSTPVADLAALDQTTSQEPFALFHEVGYVQSAPDGAYLQSAVFSLGQITNSGGTSNPFFFHAAWLATVYSSAAQAQARVDDALKTLNDGGISYDTSCSGSGQTNCAVTFIVTGGQDYLYVVFAYGNVTGELLLDADDTDLSASGGVSLFAAISDKIFSAAVSRVTAVVDNSTPGPGPGPGTNPTNTPVPTPTNTPVPRPTNTPVPTNTPIPPPSIKVDGIGLDVKGKHKRFHLARALKSTVKGVFLARIDEVDAGFNTPDVTITYSRQGRVLVTHQMRLLGNAAEARALRLGAQQASGVQSLIYGDVVAFKSKKKTVHLDATVNASLGPSKDSRTLGFTVKPNCTKTKHGKKCK